MCCLKEVLDIVELGMCRSCWEADAGTIGAGVSGACCRDADTLGFWGCCAWLWACRARCKCVLLKVSSTSVSSPDTSTSDSVLRACAALIFRPPFLGGATSRGGLVIRYYVTSLPQPGSMCLVPSYSLYCAKWSL
jgi:hypothetical protein